MTASVRTVRSKSTALRALDWAAALISLVIGVYMVASQWPAPSIWAWAILIGGLVGVPLAIFNPAARLQGAMLRFMLKKRGN